MQEWLRTVSKLAANRSTSGDEGEWRIEGWDEGEKGLMEVDEGGWR